MTNNKPTRASQSKGDSTKVVSQASTVKPKAAIKPWTPPSYLDTPNAPERIQTQMGQDRNHGISRH